MNLRHVNLTRKNWYLLVFAIFFLGVLVGTIWRHYLIYPFPQLIAWRDATRIRPTPPGNPRFAMTRYTHGIPVFADRLFYDTIEDPRLDNLLLIQIPRHHKDLISINTSQDITIYRLISDKNNNSIFDSWNKTNIQVNIIGPNSTHTTVVSKRFPPGIIDLEPGGPISSSPILIDAKEEDVDLVTIKKFPAIVNLN